MTPATLRLNPRLELVWQDPESLQFGIDPPRVVLRGLENKMLGLVQGLHAGMTEAGLAMVAKDSGVSPAETRYLIETLAPALQHEEEASRLPFLVDSRLDTSSFTAVWNGLGHDVESLNGHTEVPPGEIVVVVDFVADPDQHHRWLRLDRCHTLVAFTDQSVIVGPRVQPGVTGCLHCITVGSMAWHSGSIAIASQLWGRHAPARTPELSALGAWHCFELIHRGAPGEVRRIDALTREVTTTLATASADCDCRGIG